MVIPFISFSQKYKYKPLILSNEGIDEYVQDNSEKVVIDFQNFFRVSIPNYLTFETDSLEEYQGYQENESGLCYPDMNSIIISNEYQRYDGYSVKTTRLNGIISSNRFVRGVMIHELCHIYISNLIDSLRNDVSREYKYDRFKTYSSKFIEESICEYAVNRMGESIIDNKLFTIKTIQELYESSPYEVGVCFIGNFLDGNGFVNGVIRILKTLPPTDIELINPELYFKRL